ncbi:MAG: hypothetical protein L6408_01900 [Nanoarchaeota archaeon]|nr:hypothetical protein [Nanoarchaeota archaeon]
MKKVLFILLVLLIIMGCSGNQIDTDSEDKDAAMGDFRKTACTEAEKNNECFNGLPNLDLVTPDECCEEYSVCCVKADITDFAVDACLEAEKKGTCFEQLLKLGIVNPEQCCEVLNVCCGK